MKRTTNKRNVFKLNVTSTMGHCSISIAQHEVLSSEVVH